MDVGRHFVLWALFWYRLMVTWCCLAVLCPSTHGYMQRPDYFSPSHTKIWQAQKYYNAKFILNKVPKVEDKTNMCHTCAHITLVSLSATMWWSHFLAKAGAAGSRRWCWNGTRTRNCHGESIWTRKIPATRGRFTPHFIRDTVTAFITLLSVPCVSG